MDFQKVLTVMILIVAVVILGYSLFCMGRAEAAEPWYRFQEMPPFTEDENKEIDAMFQYEPPDGMEAETVRVLPSWTLIAQESVIWQIVACHRGVEKLDDVILTDCISVVRADVRKVSYATIEISFLTRELRGFDTSHGVYMIFLYRK